MPKSVGLIWYGLFALVATVLLGGCASPAQRGWGSETLLSPGWDKLKRAALRAAKDPGTWIPAAGATLVLASGKDGVWTQEAIRENWVYGSRNDAGEQSDAHAQMLDRVWIASLLLSDSGEEEWFSNKLRGAVSETLMVNTSIFTTNALKKAITRREPARDLVHVEYEGFPSNHSMPQFTQVALIRRNLRYAPLHDFTKYSVITGSYLLASSSAYGRVEMGLHHFSDQFAGAALGNFLGLMLYDTFFEEESSWELTLYPIDNNRGAVAQLHTFF